MLNFADNLPISRERPFIQWLWLVLAVLSFAIAAAFSTAAVYGSVPGTWAATALVASGLWIMYGVVQAREVPGVAALALLTFAVAGNFWGAAVFHACTIALALWKVLRKAPTPASEGTGTLISEEGRNVT